MSKKVYIADLTHTGNGTMALTFPLGASYVASYAKKILGKKFTREWDYLNIIFPTLFIHQ